ncbi:hypothetical protein DIPPA_04591 [Diplonema papillatum]|nr:hypothetical protein DIPPA_04591 [Diplonema papillatum]
MKASFTGAAHPQGLFSPGDALFIPKHWPHSTCSLSTSISFGPEFYAATYFWIGPAGSRTSRHSDDVLQRCNGLFSRRTSTPPISMPVHPCLCIDR